MLALLLALAILTAPSTVDPRLAEPLRPLAELQDTDATVRAIGPYHAGLPDALGLTLTVQALPRRVGAFSNPGSRTVTIAETVGQTTMCDPIPLDAVPTIHVR